MTRPTSYVIPVIPVKQAWLNLASDILLLAIEDARQERDPHKRDDARSWLLTPAAKYLIETLLPGLDDIDINDWVLAGCPILGKK